MVKDNVKGLVKGTFKVSFLYSSELLKHKKKI